MIKSCADDSWQHDGSDPVLDSYVFSLSTQKTEDFVYQSPQSCDLPFDLM